MPPMPSHCLVILLALGRPDCPRCAGFPFEREPRSNRHALRRTFFRRPVEVTMPEIDTDPDVYVLYDRRFIRTPPGRGEELLRHLASHGIASTLARLEEGPFDRVDLEGEVDPVVVR